MAIQWWIQHGDLSSAGSSTGPEFSGQVQV